MKNSVYVMGSVINLNIFLYVLTGKWNVKKVSLTEISRCIMLLVEIAITEYRTQISGVDLIFDFEGLSVQHIYQIGPSFARNILYWAQVCNIAFTVASLIIFGMSYGNSG
jgi:hypothetical protein